MSSAPVECIVCFKTVGVFSVGECDHPVCFECSTRMRVLCLQDECPICRHLLDKVIFTPECQPFKTINIQFSKNLFDHTYKIGFVNENIKSTYLKLLEHNCKKCGKSSPSFENFNMLKDHMRFKHELFFCDLCVTNLKIFTAERKFYTRSQLALHRRKGDPDDLSHKGHPICKFCETHYMDSDELYRHLRKDHLFCHLCDVDGYDHYYGSYNCLRDHFRQDHYLCEEGECGEINLTAVFRSDIDLIAHKASAHGRGLSKQASRQARTLELQFTLAPRPRGPPLPTQFRPERGEDDQNHEQVREHNLHSSPVMAIDTESTEQFPTLGDGPCPILTMTRSPAMVIRQTSGALARTEENFPALGGGKASSSMTPTLRVNITHQPNLTAGPSNAIIKTTAKPNVSIQLHNRPTSASQFKISETTLKTQKPATSRPVSEFKSNNDTNRKFEDEFPSLNKKDKNLLMTDYSSQPSYGSSLAKKLASAPPVRIVAAPVVPVAATITQPKAPPPPTSNAFPALCPTGPPISQPQWITATKSDKKDKLKASKVAPAPVIPTVSDINSAQDFPSLASNTKSKNKKSNKSDTNRKQDEDFKIEIGKKEKKKLKATEDTRSQNTSENRKSVPPDSTYEKKLKESVSTLSLDSSIKKNDIEPVWVEWKGKKNQLNGKTEEKVVSIEKPKEKNSSNAKKVVDPPILDDFPVLNAGKGLSGFGISKGGILGLNNSNKVTVNENAKNKLSYSENLKMKSINNDKVNNNNNNESENGKCKSANIIGSPTSVFHGSVPPCNGFTFTNSSGESYNIPVHNYLQPPDFNQRNKALVVNFMKALCSQESIQEFKEVSRQFREGIYSAELYYEHCRDSIKEEFEILFPELLALLPDISKQQELYKIYSELTKCSLEICPTCGQILVPSDVDSHKTSHSLLTHFPALGSPVQSTPVWRK